MEIPFDLINQLQISLRNHVNLSSYDPNDTSFPNLPTAEETIAKLDPSPPYLRCRHCNGRLLRGLQSLICVFCGREANKDVPPDPINFRNTLGCRWLLESLNLDGSEIVGPPAESNNSSRGRAAPKEEFPLSDLLDLEIKWISESEKFGSNVSNERPVQSKSSLILDGVNIENFFVEGERVATSNVFEEPSAPLKKIEAKESFQIHENLTLFENVQPTETAVPASEGASGYSDSDWGADFKSAASETPPEKSTSNDPFVVSSNLSTHMDEVFRPRKETKYSKDGEKIGSGSMSSDLFADFNSGPNMKVRLEKNVNPPSTDVDWFQDGNWQSSKNKGPANKTTDGGMDSFDDWNDFTSSTSGQDPSNNSRRQATVSSDEKNSEMDLFSSVSAQDPKNGNPVSEIRTPDEGNDSFDVWNDFTASTSTQGPSNSNKELDKKTIDEGNDSFSDWNDFTGSTSAQDPSNTSQKQATVTSDDMSLFSSASHSKDLDFLDSFSHPDPFTGAFSGPNGYTEENKLQPEASALDRASDVIVKDGGNSEVVERSGDVAAAKTQYDDVEVLMSQMHDLSFMLEKNLSIPPKSDELNSLSQD